jgi:hypothetical protein
LAALVAIVVAVAVGVGVGVARAHDPSLDLADAALEKSYVLLLNSQGPSADTKAGKQFEKSVADAMADIANARAEIAEAEAAADSALP